MPDLPPFETFAENLVRSCRRMHDNIAPKIEAVLRVPRHDRPAAENRALVAALRRLADGCSSLADSLEASE
jgi:hypothetical protein